MNKRLLLAERGSALLETALVLPLVLLISVGIFEFGRAYQTWQVLTNAVREGARLAILPGETASAVTGRVRTYMENSALPNWDTATISVTATTVSVGPTTAPASKVTVSYPFQFIMLNPVARLLGPTTMGQNPFTMTAATEMRNEQ